MLKSGTQDAERCVRFLGSKLILKTVNAKRKSSTERFAFSVWI
jgi:hypothetical protein